MNYLSAENIGKTYSDRWLFQDLTFGLSQGDKIGLVGHNGVGKTTLLKILSGEIQPDKGLISYKEGIRVGVLTQYTQTIESQTIEDLLFNEENEKAAIVKEYEKHIQMADPDPDAMQLVLQKMEDLNAWDYESKVQEVINKLGIPPHQEKMNTLSGGQKKRVYLAQLLLKEPDIIILDEPTNHLDLDAIEWLENYLSGQQITLLMVSHDRYFLDNVVNHIVELDKGKLYVHKGNYGYFLQKKAEREEQLKTEVQKAKNLLKKELEWMRRQPKARGTKAKYRIDAFYDLKEKASQSVRKDKLDLNIQETRQGGKILEVEHITKHYGSLKLVDDFSYVFKKKDRIGIVGKNGVGKSTFLDLLTQRITPDSGEVIPGQTTRFGYFTQESIQLNPANRLIEEVKEIAEFVTLADGSTVSASKFLDIFLFPPEKQYTYIEKLSGGERKRLQLLKLLVTNPNFLVLDEPTNDFDIDTLNILEDFLHQFGGCLLLVSHDRYFMDNLVDHLFIFEGDGKIRFFPGNYSDYREWREEQEIETVKPSTKVVEDKKIERKRKVSYQEQREYETLLPEIEKLENKKKDLTLKLSTADTSDHGQLTLWAQEITTIEKDIEQLTARWMELSEIIGSSSS